MRSAPPADSGEWSRVDHPSSRRSARSRARPAGADAARRARSRELGELDGEAAAHRHRVLAGGHELGRARGHLERVHVGELELCVVRVLGLAHRRAEDAAVPERYAGNTLAELHMLTVPTRLGNLAVEYECANH